jgi:hypothetical protein
MTRNLREELIRIERYTHTEGVDDPIKEVIARVPARSGVYLDRLGNELTVEVGPVDSGNNQKVIFGGESIPTKKQRGKPGQFRQVENPRRVVVFPASSHEQIRHDIGKNEHLLFTRFRMPASGGAD